MRLRDLTVFTEPQQGLRTTTCSPADRIHLQVLDLADLDHLDLIAATLA